MVDDARTRLVIGLVLLSLAAGVATGAALAQPQQQQQRRVVRSRRPARPEERACTRDVECTVAISGCCPPCGHVPANAYAAVARTSTRAWRRHDCPGYPSVGCPRCVSFGNTSVRAACVSGVCEVVQRGATSPEPPSPTAPEPPAPPAPPS